MSEVRNILVVDDEEDVRDTLAKVLKSMDYQPFVAEGGKEALEIIRNNKADSQSRKVNSGSSTDAIYRG